MMRQEEQLLEAFWSNEEQAREPLPRRDVTTSRRQLKILHLIIKCEGARDSRASKNVRPETRIWRTCNTDFENILGFLYWFF